MASRAIQIWSFLCIFCGVIVELLGLIAFLPGFCYFSRQLEFVLSGFQGVFMGFFQLSRLYMIGYPNIIFIIMYGIGIIIIIALSFASWQLQHIEHCFIDNEWNYIEKIHYITQSHNIILYIFIISAVTYIAWDLVTLSLYIIKLISIDSKSPNSVKVSRILIKIIILTALYEVTIMFLLNDLLIEIMAKTDWMKIDGILLLVLLEGLVSTSMSYAMFLMQQHNHKEYQRFLKIIHFIKIDTICCCCCKSSIIDQLNQNQNQRNHISLEMSEGIKLTEKRNTKETTITKYTMKYDTTTTSAVKNAESSSIPSKRPQLHRESVTLLTSKTF